MKRNLPTRQAKTLWLPALLALVSGSACQSPPASPPASPPSLATGAETPLRPVRSLQALSSFEVAEQDFAGENADAGTPPFTALIPTNYQAQTPILLPGVQRLTTHRLHSLLSDPRTGDAGQAPLLINVQPANAAGAELIKGAVWLSGAGDFGRLDDAVQQRLAERLQGLTAGDKTHPLIFYCADVRCWRAYNAGTRALVLGYRRVHWYRGGLRAWYEAGLPTQRTETDSW